MNDDSKLDDGGTQRRMTAPIEAEKEKEDEI